MTRRRRRKRSWQRRLAAWDTGALLFLLACAALAMPLLFPDRLPRTLVMVALVALIGVFVAHAFATRQLLPPTPVDWPNLLALALLPVGLWASNGNELSWAVALKVVAGLALFYGLAGLAPSRWLAYLPVTLLALAAALALVALLGTQWKDIAKVSWFSLDVYRFLPAWRLPWRPEGINTNLTGAAMSLLLPPAVALALWGRRWWLQLLAGATAMLVALVLVLSQSRGAWLAVVAGLLVMPWLRYRRWWIVLAALAVLAGSWVLATGIGQVGSALARAIGANQEAITTVNGRIELWGRALYLIRLYPLTGAGPGLFEQVALARYPAEMGPPIGIFNHAHNLFFHVAVEFGLPGLVAHLALLIGLAAALMASTRRPLWGPQSALAAGLFGSLLTYGLHGMVEVQIVAPRGNVLVFALWGAAAALSSRAAGLAATQEEVS